jgi:hypothetical protein
VSAIYGRLMFLAEAESKGSGKVWFLVCECGAFVRRPARDIRASVNRGYMPSCLQCKSHVSALNGQANRTHGFSLSEKKLYDVHRQMIKRCNNTSCKDYRNYGARGIVVCSDWLDIAEFILWAKGSGYREGLTIERVDNNGGYSPDNCMWIPNNRQALNTRKVLRLHFNGSVLALSDVAKAQAIAPNTIKTRLRLGWSAEEAITVPPVVGRNQYGVPK